MIVGLVDAPFAMIVALDNIFITVTSPLFNKVYIYIINIHENSCMHNFIILGLQRLYLFVGKYVC